MNLDRCVGIKRICQNETSSMLWHKRLGHIAKEKLEQLVKNGVIANLDFSNFGTCINYIKGEQTKSTRKAPQEVLCYLK